MEYYTHPNSSHGTVGRVSPVCTYSTKALLIREHKLALTSERSLARVVGLGPSAELVAEGVTKGVQLAAGLATRGGPQQQEG